jgi:hypothetical protein
VAALALPLDLLQARVDFGKNSRVNVSMIHDYPERTYISAVDLGGGEPDFHRPDRFSEVEFAPM